MIALLQKLLQLYAAKTCCRGDPINSQGYIDQIIAADEAAWTNIIKQTLQGNETTDAALLEDLQKRMEGTVLGQTSGSYVQRVQVMRSLRGSLHAYNGMDSVADAGMLLQVACWSF